MRILKKTVIRWAWTASRFGYNLLTRTTHEEPKRIRPSVDVLLDPLRHEIEEKLSSFTKPFYKIGDHFQSGLSDTVEMLLLREPDPDASLVETWEAIDRTGSP